MNLTNHVDFASQFQDSFSGSCLTRIHVGKDTNVPITSEVFLHVCSRSLSATNANDYLQAFPRGDKVDTACVVSAG
jgi:hypothetical protein